MSLCQPLAPKLKWTLRKKQKLVIFGKIEGPQTSLLETGTTVPSSKEIKLLQRQRHIEPLYPSSHRLTRGKVWIAAKRDGRFYMSCWVPSDPQPKNAELLESQPPFFYDSATLATDASPCITLLKSPNQIWDSFPIHLPILVSICLPVSYPGWWFNNDISCPLWHPLKVNLSDDFKVPMGGVTRWTMSQPVSKGLTVLGTKRHRDINSSLLSAPHNLQVNFQGPLFTAFLKNFSQY